MSFRTAAGKLFTPSAANPPGAGDQQERTDLDYVGNHLHHAKQWTASDHQLCIVDSQGNLACQAEIAIGGSLILAQVTLSNPSATVREKITGGTGAFQGVTGTVLFVNPSPATADGDLTVELQQP